jgi:hypothetical protein
MIETGRSETLARIAVRLVAVAIFGLAVLPPTALANAFGTPGTSCNVHVEPCYYDASNQRYWYDGSVGNAWRDAGEYARVTEIEGTDMNTSLVSSHSNSDVAVYLYDDPNDLAYGYSDCISASGLTCSHWHENFNTSFAYTDTKRKSLTCHEFGHTLGLHHYADHQDPQTCMETPHWHLHFNDHDIGHVNAYY